MQYFIEKISVAVVSVASYFFSGRTPSKCHHELLLLRPNSVQTPSRTTLSLLPSSRTPPRDLLEKPESKTRFHSRTARIGEVDLTTEKTNCDEGGERSSSRRERDSTQW
ncbi:hypothetical protein L484_021994 [Morus notabilis]|uniref:Uncharacterized protein n=1 Tax=Morus notabilis TaxID=981085 RepID=W9QXH8_9ROSA|nr:hypothetical protein L484_021994 [Morus notabilis]